MYLVTKTPEDVNCLGEALVEAPRILAEDEEKPPTMSNSSS